MEFVCKIADDLFSFDCQFKRDAGKNWFLFRAGKEGDGENQDGDEGNPWLAVSLTGLFEKIWHWLKVPGAAHFSNQRQNQSPFTDIPPSTRMFWPVM